MQQFRLYGAVIAAMLIWSFSFIWTRMAILSFPPVTLITLRLVFAALLLFLFSYFTGKFQKIKKHDLKWFLLLAFFEPYMYYMGETYGLTMVDATTTSVIISTIPLFAPILAFLFLKERISIANMTGILISLSGVFMVVYQPQDGFSANPFGIILLFLAIFSAICYTTVLRKISTEYNILNVIFYQSLFGLIFFLPTFLIVDLDKINSIHLSFNSISAFLMLVIFASVIAFVLFAWVVRQIGVARTNVFVNLIPVFTAVFSFMLLNEQLRFFQWTGIAVVVGGLFVSQIRSKPQIPNK